MKKKVLFSVITVLIISGVGFYFLNHTEDEEEPIRVEIISDINKETTEEVVQEILENPEISEENKQWLKEFNELSYEEQISTSYRPAELSSYDYEKDEPPYQGEKWWVDMSDEEVIDTLYNSLVFENEYTKEIFRGVENLEFAYAIEEGGHGGLILKENPYDVILGYNFYAHPDQRTTETEFSGIWNTPDGSYQFLLPKFKVKVPKKIEKMADIMKNLNLKPVYRDTEYGKMFSHYE